jgi:hypothetical protein
MKTTLIVISSIIVCQVLFPTSTLASIQIRANERSLTNRSELAQNINSAQSYLEIGINKHDAGIFEVRSFITIKLLKLIVIIPMLIIIVV